MKTNMVIGIVAAVVILLAVAYLALHYVGSSSKPSGQQSATNNTQSFISALKEQQVSSVLGGNWSINYTVTNQTANLSGSPEQASLQVISEAFTDNASDQFTVLIFSYPNSTYPLESVNSEAKELSAGNFSYTKGNESGSEYIYASTPSISALNAAYGDHLISFTYTVGNSNQSMSLGEAEQLLGYQISVLNSAT